MRPLLCVLLLSLACSTTPALTLSATPNPLPGDGETPATVVAKVTQGGAPAEGVMVHFTTSAGTFKESSSGAPLLADVQVTGGVATASLVPPRQGWGEVKITASASVDGLTPTDSKTLPLSPAGGLAASLSFTCQHQNIGAFVHGRQETIHVLCVATAKDSKGAVIPKASIQTLAEAGVLEWSHDDVGGQQFIYSVAPDAPAPVDTDPLDGSGVAQAVCAGGCASDPFGSTCQGEPCWTDSTGLTHNPRDGVVTLVAAVPGIKSFDDQGEPYVDSNDNGKRDPGEAYIDYNANGKYDVGGKGQLQDRLIWKAYRIVWSGELSVTPTGQSRTTHDAFLTQSGKSVTAHLFDRNFNALAADGPSASDGINFSGACSDDGQIAAADFVMEQIEPGVLFNASDGSISTPTLRSTWSQKTDYFFPTGFTSATHVTQACTISAAVHRRYNPGAPGFDSSGAENPDAVPAATFSFAP